MINEPKNSEDDFDPKKQVKEYKRKCNECRKVWHSLATREEMIQKDIKSNNCSEAIAACGMCGGHWSAFGASAQIRRNKHALTEELERLKKCPKCGSGNYNEKVFIYDKK